MGQGTDATPDVSPSLPIDPLDHEGLVVEIAKAYRNKGIDLEDLIQEGYVGLVKACKGFDPSQGFEFSTYAARAIRQSISRSFKNNTRVAAVSQRIYDLMSGIKKGRIKEEDLKESYREQIADARNILGLSLFSGDDTLADICAPAEGRTEDDASSCRIKTLMSALTDIQGDVVRSAFGFDGHHFETFDDIARRLGLSHGKVIAIYSSALRRMRNVEGQRPAEIRDGAAAWAEARIKAGAKATDREGRWTNRFKGVFPTKSNRYQVQVHIGGGKNRYGGTFDTIEEARQRANKLGREFLGVEEYATERKQGA